MNMKLFPEYTLNGVGAAILRILVLTYVLFGIVLYVRQDAMLFFPDQTPFANCPELADATLVSMEGTRGYFFQNGTSSDIMVFYHGNGGRACDRAVYRTIGVTSGYSVLIVEYTGYAGDTSNTPSTKTLMTDVSRVARWVAARNPRRLAIVGESIGTGAASYHASLAQTESLALVAPFDRLSSAAFDVYPVYPMALLLRNDLDNVKWAKSAERVLILHGTSDPVIHYARGRALFDSLPQSDKQFIPLAGATHEDVLSSSRVFIAIAHFLQHRTP